MTACLNVDVIGACVVFDGVVVMVSVVAASVVDRLVAACVDVVVLTVAVAAAAFFDVIVVVDAAVCVFVVNVVKIVVDSIVVTVAIVGASLAGSPRRASTSLLSRQPPQCGEPPSGAKGAFPILSSEKGWQIPPGSR